MKRNCLIKCLFVSAMMFSLISCSTSEKKDIVIVYTADTHGYIANTPASEEEKAIRFSNIAAYVKDLKAEGNEVLLVDCGDHLQGSPYASHDKGSSIIDLMNEVGYDLATIGNHEFDYGMEKLNENISKAKFSYISSNFRHNGERVLEASKIFKIGGVSVGFVGLTTPTTISSSTPRYFQDEKGKFVYSFDGSDKPEDLYQTVQNSVNDIKDKVDYVIGLGHVGVDMAEIAKKVTFEDVVKNTTGMNAFISAHSHLSVENNVVKNKENKDVIVSEPGSHLNCFGVMEIKKDGTITTQLKKFYDNQDKIVKDKEEKLIKNVDDSLNEIVAKTSNKFYVNDSEHPDWRVIRCQETNLGDLFSDSYYWYFNEKLDIDCDISVVNGGGLRGEINPGEMSRLSVKSVTPFENELCLIKATGQEIKDALEMGSCNVGLWDSEWNSPAEEGGFLHVGGMKYTIDCSIDSTIQKDNNGNFIGAPTGEYKVRDLQVFNRTKNCYEAIELTKTYTIAGSNYLLRNGGNGLSMFVNNDFVVDYVCQDYMASIDYVSAFAVDNDLPEVSSQNSPVGYLNYLLDYESAKGAGRINVLNVRY